MGYLIGLLCFLSSVFAALSAASWGGRRKEEWEVPFDYDPDPVRNKPMNYNYSGSTSTTPTMDNLKAVGAAGGVLHQVMLLMTDVTALSGEACLLVGDMMSQVKEKLKDNHQIAFAD